MNRNIEVTLVLLYAVPSIVLYAGIIFMLIRRFKKKEFCSPFYKLFLVNGILDILCWILLYFDMRVENASWFYWYFKMIPSSGVVPTFIVWLGYYVFYAEITTYFFITLNRFTAICWPLANHKIWNRLFPISIAIILLIPLPATWHMLVAGGYCIPNDDQDPPLFGYRLDANTVFNIQNSWFGTAFCFTAGFSGLAMNTWMIVCLFLRRKSTDAGRVASDTKDGEIKLLIFSSLVFLAFSLSVAIQIIFVLNPNMSDSMFWNVIEIQFYAWDIFMLSPPWFILILSKTIRKEFFKMLGFKNSTILFVSSTPFKTRTAHSHITSTVSTLRNNRI